jgi:hypothetical protein
MIVGFDHDDASVFKVIPGFLSECRIGNALVGLLHAIPTTPLFDRLKEAGRLNDSADSAIFGTNVVPLGMNREDLRQGFIDVMQQAYSPDGYFNRIDALFLRDHFAFSVHHLAYWKNHRLAWAKRCAGNYAKFLVLTSRLLRRVEDPALSARYRRQLGLIVRARALEPHILFIYAIKIAMHFHYASIVKALSDSGDGRAIPKAAISFSRGAAGASVHAA